MFRRLEPIIGSSLLNISTWFCDTLLNRDTKAASSLYRGFISLCTIGAARRESFDAVLYRILACDTILIKRFD